MEMRASSTEAHVASILNAAWMVRHYARGGRNETISKRERTAAIRQLGVIVRDAFNSNEEYEVLLAAIVDGLRPKEAPPF